MTCPNCSTTDQPAAARRRRFCVGCGRRFAPPLPPSLPPSLALVRRGRLPLRPAVEELEPVAG